MNKHKILQLIRAADNESNFSFDKRIKLFANKFNAIGNKLYKYYGTSEYTLYNLENDIIYLNNPSSFNDPFDCYLGYSRKDFLEQFCLAIIIEDDLKANNVAGEAFAKFIMGEELQYHEMDFFNKRISIYGKEFANTKITDWVHKGLTEKLPLFCNLICDDGKKLAHDILQYCDRMAQIQNNVRKVIDENYLVTCFSETYTNNLMWAHYADKNRGICVEYDFTKSNDPDVIFLQNCIFPVIYSPKRPQIPVVIESRGHFSYYAHEDNYGLTEKYLFLLTKGLEWKYEREWRMILQESKNRVFKFPIISKIYLGVNISKEFEKRVVALAKRKNVEIKKLSVSVNEYKLND